MIELAKCPACGPGCSISKYTSDQQSRFGVTCTCGLGSTRRKTPELAARSWNALCEEIRWGKKIAECVEYGMAPGNPCITRETNIGIPVEEYAIIIPVLPIPAPVAKDEEMDRLWQATRTTILNTPAFDRTRFQLALLARIDAVLGGEQ